MAWSTSGTAILSRPRASAKRFSDHRHMAERDLRLHGYEIYRFGANELVGDGAPDVIAEFFERLLKLHKVFA